MTSKNVICLWSEKCNDRDFIKTLENCWCRNLQSFIHSNIINDRNKIFEGLRKSNPKDKNRKKENKNNTASKTLKVPRAIFWVRSKQLVKRRIYCLKGPHKGIWVTHLLVLCHNYKNLSIHLSIYDYIYYSVLLRRQAFSGIFIIMK